MSKYKNVRFFLFTNSYSAQLISQYFRKKYKSSQLSKSKKLAEEIKRLSCVLFFSNKNLMRFFIFDIKPKCPLKRISLPLKVYLEIEKEIIRVTNEKLDELSSFNRGKLWVELDYLVKLGLNKPQLHPW